MHKMENPNNEITFVYMQEFFKSGINPSNDFLQLLINLMSNAEDIPSAEQMYELPYYLNDLQRQKLQQLVLMANRLNDAQINAEISEEGCIEGRERRFGITNPQQLDIPFWTFMVRRGWTAYQAREYFNSAFRHNSASLQAQNHSKEVVELLNHNTPVWCFNRFGMSCIKLLNGSLLYIGGEHEDFYDEDFCIYNDVIVIDPQLRIKIYTYPKEVFFTN